MSIDRKIGLELRDGQGVGRDPDQMTAEELIALGHSAMSPLKALRLRCIDCYGGSLKSVRGCTSTDCPSWPFRMGRKPWRAPASEERKQRASDLAARRPRAAKNQRQGRGFAETDEGAATTLPASTPEPHSPVVSVCEEEGA
jgi:hypothetical protein